MKTADDVVAHLETLRNPATAEFLQRYFQSGPGGYGEGDRFLGIRVPVLRKLSASAAALSLAELRRLLRNPWHEARLLALLALVHLYRRGDDSARDRIHALYLAHTRWINNWDLVDTSAEHLVGAHLRAGRASASVLNPLLVSPSVWERRVAILAMLHYIRAADFPLPLHILAASLRDPHPLIHKATGWMLREIGKRDRATLESFLAAHAPAMPRTALRYAIEHFPPEERRRYLSLR